MREGGGGYPAGYAVGGHGENGASGAGCKFTERTGRTAVDKFANSYGAASKVVAVVGAGVGAVQCF